MRGGYQPEPHDGPLPTPKDPGPVGVSGPNLDEAHYPERAPEPSPLDVAITNMDRSVGALLLELPDRIWEDVQDRWSALRKLIKPPTAPAPAERFIWVVTDEMDEEQNVILTAADVMFARNFVDWVIAMESKYSWSEWIHYDKPDHPESWFRYIAYRSLAVTKYKVDP